MQSPDPTDEECLLSHELTRGRCMPSSAVTEEEKCTVFRTKRREVYTVSRTDGSEAVNTVDDTVRSKSVYRLSH